MILSPRVVFGLKAAAILLLLLALLRAPFEAGALGLVLGIPPLAAVAWRRSGAYVAASFIAAAVLVIGMILMAVTAGTTPTPQESGRIPMAALMLAVLAAMSYAGWLFLSSAEERAHARRKVLEDLEEELAQMRADLGQQEKALTVSENRRKRYSRLQESVSTLASTLEVEKLAELTLQQASQLLSGLPVDISLFLLDAGGKELLRKEKSLGGGAPFGPEAKVQEDPLSAWVLAKGASLVIKDLEKDFRFRGLDMASFQARSFHLSPLLSSQGTVAGLVRVASSKRESMDQEDGRLLESLVVLASLAFENAKLYREAQELAVTDGLTRLLLRRSVLERIDQELKRGDEQSTPTSLVMMDIDHFKSVNDTYGHPAGDAVLRDVAAIVRRSVRDVDVCGRYGGEEFAVLLPQTDAKGAKLVAERIREAVRARPFELRGESRQVTISLGVATAPVQGKDTRSLLEAADEALYASKQGGRDRVTLSTIGGEAA
jgi:diguanylate cyclase (GGDEF)-like protein